MALIVKSTGFEEFLDSSGGSWVKALVMGAAGAGKTRSASFWPKPIFADCERGLMSVADRGVPYVEIKSSLHMDQLLDHLRLDGLKPVDKRAYGTLVIDTIDSYQRVLIQERLRTERKEALSGWADWGFLDAKMSQLIERMINLPMNIVVNLHVKDERNDDGESTTLVKKARLKGDIKDSIFQDFDLIGQMETSYVPINGERVLTRQIRWHSEPQYPTLRDRSGKLPRFTDVDFTEGDFTRIFDAITSGLDELPETKTVETLSEDPADVPAADTKGGPLEEPKLPAAKKVALAKKTAPPVKKTAAEKKAEAKAEDPTVKSVVEPAGEPKSDVEPEPSTDVESEGTDAAVALVQEELGAEVLSEEETPTEEPPAQKSKPKSQEKPAVMCGDQPESMTKFPAFEGCGKALDKDNATKSQIALLRTKTYICDDCFENRWKTAQAS